MRNHTRNKAKQLRIVYFQNIHILPFGFLPYYRNALPCVLKDVDVIYLLVFNQLEFTNSVKLRILNLPYDGL